MQHNLLIGVINTMTTFELQFIWDLHIMYRVRMSPNLQHILQQEKDDQTH